YFALLGPLGLRLWMIFRWPLLLALLGLFGLLSALLGDGLYDLLSWLALGTPLVLVGWELVSRELTHEVAYS
ncbi:hypothetical protein ACLBSJ_33940, partial [Klebsiella pneumoniae]|uniref:hypothetical protein n=1 Tax=Klebsiella pneumoniae TaxID=573 RepID=UPI00396991FF